MEQERIPFDIKFRPDIEAGKYLVETREGVSVRIICWDRIGPNPIVALLSHDDYEGQIDYYKDGRYNPDKCCRDDLFLVPNPYYKEPAAKSPVDWDAFRMEAAKDFVGAILSNSALVDDRSWDYRVNVIGTGVAYADELIKQLKEG